MMKKTIIAGALTLIISVTSQASVTSGVDTSFGGCNFYTIDPNTDNNTGHSFGSGKLEQQTFVLLQGINDINRITLSAVYRPVTVPFNVTVSLYSVTDPNATDFASASPTLLHTFTASVDGSLTTSMPDYLSLTFAGADVFSLAAGNYAVEISNDDSTDSSALQMRFARGNGTPAIDYYSAGQYYEDSTLYGNTTSDFRDFGVGLAGTLAPVPEPATAGVLGIGVLSLLVMRRYR